MREPGLLILRRPPVGALPVVAGDALADVAAVTSENAPSNVAASEKPFSHFISAAVVTSALSRACAAPLTTKLAPGTTAPRHSSITAAPTQCDSL